MGACSIGLRRSLLAAGGVWGVFLPLASLWTGRANAACEQQAARQEGAEGPDCGDKLSLPEIRVTPAPPP